MHGVSLSIGSTDPLDFEFLGEAASALAARVRAVWMGDHICWTGVAGLNGHDLYPVPYTEESLKHLIERVRIAQDFLERPLVLENPSTYLTFRASSMPEEEFIARLAEEADCALLLDVNNVYVTCRNHDLDPFEYLRAIPYDRVVQIHLAGHTDHGTHCIDTHNGRVIDPVWDLYAEVQRRRGNTATLLEWDADIPKFDVLQREVGRANRFRDSAARRERLTCAERPELERLERWMQAVVMHPQGAARGVAAPGARALLPTAARDLESVVTRSQTTHGA